MLYPRSNQFRQCIDLSGFWDIQFDPEGKGHRAGWHEGVSEGRPTAVPASWNDQFEDWRDYLGNAWYQTTFTLPWGWNDQPVFLRFGSVNYFAEVWLNGVRLGDHEGGHLPFEFDVTAQVKAEGNVLVVRVDGELAPDRVPPGNLPPIPNNVFSNMKSYPAAAFDFFPFCGIHRPVLLYTKPTTAIQDITVVTDIDGSDGVVRVRVESNSDDVNVRCTLRGHRAELSSEGSMTEETVLRVPDAALWEPGAPNLYDLHVELLDYETPCDAYTLSIGIRTIAVDGDALLLNGKPITLTGFGRHEDFPITGRGFLPAVVVKDYSLLRWIGANSFRTSHYPYSEEMMDLADRLGFLVIDETPAVGLFFAENSGMERRLELCSQYTRELIARDKNHPSVIMWSLANEPQSEYPAAMSFFQNLFDLARECDDTRPLTLVNMLMIKDEKAFELCDVVCVNRYNGWYSESGQLDVGCENLSVELDAIHETYPKPLLLTEFGADTLAGHHALPAEMFSEEYQAEMMTRYIELLNSKPYVVGQHVWNMCDFKTGQFVLRMQSMNLKGVFTRDRRPKMAAHRLRELWTADK